MTEPWTEAWLREWCTPKELAGRLGVSVSYLYALKRAGLEFRGQWSTMADVTRFLEENPDFTVRKAAELKRRAMSRIDEI